MFLNAGASKLLPSLPVDGNSSSCNYCVPPPYRTPHTLTVFLEKYSQSSSPTEDHRVKERDKCWCLLTSPFVFQLCQMVRLVPGAYLEYKAALVNECNKQGGLRLAQARALIKIDVNKTRKIYDFLIREGYITKA